jgi:hypothetical protein
VAEEATYFMAPRSKKRKRRVARVSIAFSGTHLLMIRQLPTRPHVLNVPPLLENTYLNYNNTFLLPSLL